MKYCLNSKILFGIFALILLPALCLAGMPELLAPGSDAPVSSLAGTDDQRHTFPAAGKWSIVFYWSMFCHSCLDEIPAVQTHLEQNNIAAETFFVTLDTKRMEKAVRNFCKKRQLSRPVLFEEIASDSYVTADKWGVVMTPSVFIVAPDGKITYSHAGPMDIDKFFNEFAEMQKKHAKNSDKQESE